MEVYRRLYYHLFAAISDAVESLEKNEPFAAKKRLIDVQRQAEELVISCEEETQNETEG